MIHPHAEQQRIQLALDPLATLLRDSERHHEAAYLLMEIRIVDGAQHRPEAQHVGPHRSARLCVARH
jgi:hypothetical protein